MIAPEFEDFLLSHMETYLVPSDQLAIIIDTHKTEHVMLLLSANGFSRVPVITKDNEYVGTISISDILKYQLDHQLDDESFAKMDIVNMVNTMIPTIGRETTLTEVMNKLVDWPFLPMTEENGEFIGIITRKTILKAVNALLHDFTSDYTITDKKKDA